jgi:hypothetical protein
MWHLQAAQDSQHQNITCCLLLLFRQGVMLLGAWCSLGHVLGWAEAPAY